MAKEITRTFLVTVADGYEMVERDGNVEANRVTVRVDGKRTPEQVARLMAKEGRMFKVRDIAVVEELRGMSVKDFLENSHIVTRPPSQQKKQ